MRECEKYLFELLCELIIKEKRRKKWKFDFLKPYVYQHFNTLLTRPLTRSKMFNILI